MRFYKYTAIYTPEKEDKNVYYDVSIPAYPEIHTFGDSIEEARFMAQDALELTILSMLDDDIHPRADKKSQRVAKNAKVEDIVVAIDHKVSATPFENVKNSIFQTA